MLLRSQLEVIFTTLCSSCLLVHGSSSVSYNNILSQSCQAIASVATSLPNDFVLERIHMTNTGGQPELMEVIPSLIHNAIVLVDFRYGLNEHSHVDYHQKGVCYK